MIDDARIPDPQPEPSGALVPPPSDPSTALAISAPLPLRRRDEDMMAARDFFARVVRSTLDTLDNVGDSIAVAVGLR